VPVIRFRPHHFLCTLGFEGKGYSSEFVRNFSDLAERLRESPKGDDEPIQVVSTSDHICQPCPHRRGDRCENESKITQLDQAHSQILGLKDQEVVSWGQAKERIREKMSIEDFHSACAPCEWKKLGVCEKALKRLRRAVDQDGQK